MTPGLTERVPRLPAPAATPPGGREYSIRVWVLGGKPERFTFDQSKLVVGRGPDSDLRIEHRCISRRQFLLERSIGSAGEPRFRIVPCEEATNATHVNQQQAVEGTIMPGDLIAVGEVRIKLERDRGGAKAESGRGLPATVGVDKQPGKGSPLRLVLMALAVIMVGVVGYLFLFEEEESAPGEMAGSDAPLFGELPEVHCGNPVECDNKAHEGYDRGRKLMSSASADAGNYYRATLEFERARSYAERSGRPLGDMGDVEVWAKRAREAAEKGFDDARFELTQAQRRGDVKRCAEVAARLAHIIPDDKHPYRVQLDTFRRTLPKPKEKGAEEATP